MGTCRREGEGMKTSEIISLVTVPFFMGAIGYVTNWTGVWMLFEPVQFKGVRVPGLRKFAELFPRKVQDVPGIMNGGLGWQGIIPSRAAKMGSIAVDKGIAKLGGASSSTRGSSRTRWPSTSSTRRGRHPRARRHRRRARAPAALAAADPRPARGGARARRAPVPRHRPPVTDEIGKNIDQLLDVKLMVIRKIEERPELSNKIFRSVGDKEFRFIINFGFFFGFAAASRPPGSSTCCTRRSR